MVLTAAAAEAEVGEPPDVAEAHGVADDGQQVLRLA